MHPPIDCGLGDRATGRLVVRRLGRRGFVDARALQERAARAVAAGGADELLFVEHAPVITLGRGTAPGQLLASLEELARVGIAVHEADRGGGATYHGPGQIVGYPIVDLRRRGLGPRRFLRALEGAIAGCLREAGIDAIVRPGLTGVWTPRGKIAAIGIAVRGGVTRHGFALNVAPEPDAFARIVPCGLREPVTSLEAEGWEGDRAGLQHRIADALGDALAASASKPGASAERGEASCTEEALA